MFSVDSFTLLSNHHRLKNHGVKPRRTKKVKYYLDF
jgi:hypothetical protein